MISQCICEEMLLTHLSQLSVSDPSFSITFTVLVTFELRGIFTDPPMATGAFMTLGSVLTFSPLMHSSCSPGLAGVELEVYRAKVLLLE